MSTDPESHPTIKVDESGSLERWWEQGAASTAPLSTVVFTDPDVLELKKTGCLVGLLVLGVVVGCALLAVMIAAAWHVRSKETVLIAVFTIVVLALPMTLLGVGGLLKRPVRFDRARGEVTFGWPGRRRRRALNGITGLLIQHRPPWRAGGGRQIRPYRLKLVFSDRAWMCLSSTSDLSWTRETGRELAEFLKIPFVDETSR